MMLSGNCHQEFLSSDFLCVTFFSAGSSQAVAEITTISSRLTFYQLGRKEQLILKVPGTWLASQDPITVTRDRLH